MGTALENTDILLLRLDQGFVVAACRDDIRIAMIGQDKCGIQCVQPIQILQMGVKIPRLADIGYGVFHGVTCQQNAA